jgi:hypothetical protein
MAELWSECTTLHSDSLITSAMCILGAFYFYNFTYTTMFNIGYTQHGEDCYTMLEAYIAVCASFSAGTENGASKC